MKDWKVPGIIILLAILALEVGWLASHPRETAEVMLLLANLWMVPLFNPLTDEGAYERRVEVFLRVMRALGVDMADWEALSSERLDAMGATPWPNWKLDAPAGEARDGCAPKKQPEVG